MLFYKQKLPNLNRYSKPPKSIPLLIASALIVLFIETSVSAYTDAAHLNIGEPGIGNKEKFDIGLVAQGNIFLQADNSPLNIPIPGHNALVPGSSITTNITAVNNSNYNANLTLDILTIGNGAVGSAPNITPFLRFSAKDTDTNNYIFGGDTSTTAVPINSATGNIGTLTKRSLPPLIDGSTWIAGNAGSFRTIKITIFYPDSAAANNNFNGGLSATQLSITGTSV